FLPAGPVHRCGVLPCSPLFRSLPTNSKNRNRSQTLAVLLAERAPGVICDLAATHVGLDGQELIDVLHELSISERLRKVMEFVSQDRKSTRLNSSHVKISYAVFC